MLRTIEGVDIEPVSKHRPTHRNLYPAVQVIAVTGELFVRLDADIDVQVARGTAAFADFSLMRQTQPGVIVDARRDSHSDITGSTYAAMPHARRARMLDDGPMSFATFARRGCHHLAEHRAHDFLAVPLSVAVGACHRLGAFCGARAAAFLAQAEGVDSHVGDTAEHRGFQVDGRSGERIPTRLGARGGTLRSTAAESTAEELSEDIADIAHIEAGSSGPETA